LIEKWTYLVVVSTPDLASAHRIFAVMNDRGLDLRPTDNFKARVIGEVAEDHQDFYTAKWEDAEEDLGRDAFSSLFSHIRMLFAKQRSARELLREFPEQVLDRYIGRAEKFIDDVLEPYANAYMILLDQSYKHGPEADAINLWLRRLAQLDNVDWQPPALWALKHHGNEPEVLDRFLGKLERLAASMLIRRVGPTERQQRYGRLLMALEGGDGLYAEPMELTDDERAETLRLLDGDVYRQARVRKYVLLRLDEEFANEPGVTYNHKIITVEHVLPQNPALDSEWRRIFSERERTQWMHRIGNLVLLNRSKNAQAQNLDFAAKKQKYFNWKKGVATFALTVDIMTTPEWTPEVLQQRQHEALRRLTSAWDLEPSGHEEDETAAADGNEEGTGRLGKFRRQLMQWQAPDTCDGVQRVIEKWIELGGHTLFGGGSETSCFLMAPNPLEHHNGLWPITIYPKGRCEVVFQHLATRAPFDRAEFREEFRARLNTVTGVSLSASKLRLRPSFPLTVLDRVEDQNRLIEQLAWFTEQVHLSANNVRTLR
jgi:hypothetical protein